MVNDSFNDSLPAELVVEAKLNTTPVADAGGDRTVDVGAEVTVDGRQSSDADGDALKYVWNVSVPHGSSYPSGNWGTGPFFVFHPDVAGTFSFYLFVDDGRVMSPTVSITVTAR